jgi:hypothetical protein
LKKQSFECRLCNNRTKISAIYIRKSTYQTSPDVRVSDLTISTTAYAAKLLFQELASMNIA